ncbi:MAG: acetyl-CoA carboxylase biotin carboxyl carrier protein [Flavobacteriales bacterium]|nr:acetyl-CoA carboxylase biotin carboxyl carrier protein [Flavobacteriales bacterium]
MDLEKIQALIKFVAKSGVTEVELETEEFKINIKTPSKKKPGESTEPAIISAPIQTVAAVQPIQPVQPVQAVQPVAAPVEQAEAKEKAPAQETKADSNNYIEVKSPMIGTFYRSASPEKPPFVNVGDNISVGQTICIVEAMKLFNEIESEVSGKIVKVLVDDSTPIEYDQPLFLVEPA